MCLGLAVLLVEGETLAVVGLERCEADAVDVVEDRLEALLGQGGLSELVVIAYARRLWLLLGDGGGL